MNAEILSIGTELLLGEIADTNAAYLASELADIGVPLYWISQIGDNPGRLRQAFGQALARSDIVITTGGLGPTDDDQTREAIAAVLNETPEVDPDLERTLRKRFGAMGRDMPEKNVKQAWLIPSAEPLLNPLGTAPGWWVTTQDGRHIASMPGVPSEMRGMWSDQIRPRIEAMSRASFKSVTLKTFGAGESAIEERLGDLVQSANPSVATYAKRDGVYVRVAASASDEAEAAAILEPVLEEVKQRLGSDVFGSANDSLGSVVGALLQERNSTIATAESITGGLVVSYLTDVPGELETRHGWSGGIQRGGKTPVWRRRRSHRSLRCSQRANGHRLGANGPKKLRCRLRHRYHRRRGSGAAWLGAARHCLYRRVRRQRDAHRENPPHGAPRNSQILRGPVRNRSVAPRSGRFIAREHFRPTFWRPF